MEDGVYMHTNTDARRRFLTPQCSSNPSQRRLRIQVQPIEQQLLHG